MHLAYWYMINLNLLFQVSCIFLQIFGSLGQGFLRLMTLYNAVIVVSCLVESVFVFLAACIGIRQCCPVSDHNSRSHHQCPQKHQPPSLLPGHIFCPHQRGHRYRLPTDWHCRHWPRQRKSYTQPFYNGLLCTSVSLLIFYTDVCHYVNFFWL